MVFTCKVYETRSVKTACRESYEKGVVVARCEGCNNLHLIADRLGWFGQPGSVEDLLVARREEVKKGSADTLNLTLEDLVGTKSNGLQQEMQKYMSLRQMMHKDVDAPELQKEILLSFWLMSRLFIDPVKAEEDFQILDQLKDSNVWKILSALLDPSISFQ